MKNSVDIDQALDVLGVSGISTDEDIEKSIKRKYYERAFELHPDKNGTKEEFQKLLSAYHLICGLLKDDRGYLNRALEKRLKGNTDTLKNEAQKDFQIYKKAVRRYSDTIEEYYERVKQVNLNPEDHNYQQLCERLKIIKTEFFQIIRMNPAGIWVPDCIEKISRINVWIKAGNYSSR